MAKEHKTKKKMRNKSSARNKNHNNNNEHPLYTPLFYFFLLFLQAFLVFLAKMFLSSAAIFVLNGNSTTVKPRRKAGAEWARKGGRMGH